MNILQRMRERGYTRQDLADALQLDDSEVNALMAGELEVTETLAEKLCVILGGTVRGWLE